ncbi:prefoldin subunit, putative [Candida dubliniensis CD36]|uniref:Prefoldin subunit, putative n=1 Tax=Candida dubliniensis (strain CD36 / ATCC MYA-646 / CBS 7987 / NCPF 3949 / NRRL Y-17841) TaxID=573826 RepID=B9W717_CANDC|nr:prefoldin subunit, putative [Candida dubliniensis CD36]CAX44475.1 prefoldin subunit, putative [Candida dubliniensis CD36]
MNQEALQKVLIEMDNQLNKSQSELSMINLQLERINHNLKIIDTTKNKLNNIIIGDNDNNGDNNHYHYQSNEKIWQNCGKAFISTNFKTYLNQLNKDNKNYQDIKKSLIIKQDYLKTTVEKTIEGMTNIVGKK